MTLCISKCYLIYLNYICNIMLICVTLMYRVICFHAVFLSAYMYFARHQCFLSLLSDFMRPAHDGTQWK